jgi:hypothetical protein
MSVLPLSMRPTPGIEDHARLVRRDAADVAGPSAPPSLIGAPAGTVNAMT